MPAVFAGTGTLSKAGGDLCEEGQGAFQYQGSAGAQGTGATEQPPEKNNPNTVGAEMIGNGNAAKLDIREWHPNHERCGKGITLTDDEGRNLYAALKAIYEKE